MKKVAVFFVLFFVGLTVCAKDPSLKEADPPVAEPSQPPYVGNEMDGSFKIVRPSFFVFLREAEKWKQKGTSEEIEKVVHVANAERAMEFGYPADVLDPWAENITVIEEPSYWLIVFHMRGNGYVLRELDGTYANYEGARPERLYYVDKTSFRLIESPPEGAVLRAPTYTAADAFDIDVNYISDPSDAFISIEEAQRKNREKAKERPIKRVDD